jgi:hypothetical protein
LEYTVRRIEFKSSVNGLTKIFVDGKELATTLDPKALRAFRASKLPPNAGPQIVDAVTKKLANDNVSMTKEETNFILKYLKDELGL